MNVFGLICWNECREESWSSIKKTDKNISAFSSGNIDIYEYLTGEEILPPQQHRIIQAAKFFHSPLGRELEKQTKIIEEHGKKQVEALQSLDLAAKTELK